MGSERSERGGAAPEATAVRSHAVPEPRILRLPDGRDLAYDDTGDPSGTPVVYLHGTPDSRLARHPDESVAADLGVRLLAVDRPGAGRTDPPPTDPGWQLGDDLATLLDSLGAAGVGLLGWSSGGLAAIGAAARLGGRVQHVATVATLPPVEAYRDEDLVAALGMRRRPFVELAVELLDEGLSPAEIAAEVAPHLVPDPLDEAAARAHVEDSAGPEGLAALAAVPGAVDQLTAALLEAVRGGHGGLESQVAEQLVAGVDLAAVRAPVVLWHGAADDVAPPAVGAWLAARLPDARVEVVPGGHEILLTEWSRILRGVVAD